MGKIEIKYGLIIGLGVSAYAIIEFLLGFHTTRMEIGEYSGYGSSLIPIIALWFAIAAKKKEQENGILPIKVGFLTGLNASILASFIIAVFFAIYYKYINPNFLTMESEHIRQQLTAMHVPQDEIAKEINEEAEMSKQPMQFLLAFIGTTFMGALISIIIALIVRRPWIKTETTS